MLSRRAFLQSSGLLALAPTVPGFLAQGARAAPPQRDGRVLVVVELNGGNDGINTVVPFKDEGYARHRKTLRLPADKLVKVDGKVGLHPALRDAGKLLESGRLTILQGVGYPNPSRSHFESMAVWHSARRNGKKRAGTGWLGRALDSGRQPADGGPASVLVGLGGIPLALRGTKAVSSSLAHLDDLVLAGGGDPKRALPEAGPGGDLQAFVRRSLLDAYTTAERLKEAARVKDSGVRYPGSGLADRLRLVARLLKAGFGTRVYYTVQGGYDTHFAQLTAHDLLLGELAGALRAFLDDLAAAKLAERVVVLCFSEFGRTVKENGSAGTDHGTAGPVFLAGAPVKGGVVGETPSLLDLDPRHGDLRVGVDFRRIYATLLHDWLGLSAKEALAGTFEPLTLFRS
jgi:uncharacterized protein (DUF1501 family)